MKLKRLVLCIAAVLLCMPVGYLAARDIVVRIALATDSLVRHEHVGYEYVVTKNLTEGEDEGLRDCSVVVNESWRGVSVTYPISCDTRFSEDGSAEVLPGIFSDEVIVLHDTTIWHGEPSDELHFIPAVIYAASYFTVLYVVTRRYLRERPSIKTHARGIAIGLSVAGSMTCYALVILVTSPFDGDPILAMIVGMAIVLLACRRIVRGPKTPVVPVD